MRNVLIKLLKRGTGPLQGKHGRGVAHSRSESFLNPMSHGVQSERMRGEVEAGVRQLILQLVPTSWKPCDLIYGLPIHKGGLNLDSVAVFELMLACEKHFEVSIGEDLLEESDLPLTVGDLIGYIEQRCKEAACGGPASD